MVSKLEEAFLQVEHTLEPIISFSISLVLVEKTQARTISVLGSWHQSLPIFLTLAGGQKPTTSSEMFSWCS